MSALVACFDLRDDAPAGLAITDHAIAKREERVIATQAHIAARMDLRTELANENRSGRHGLACEHLDSAPLPVTVAAVARAALSLLCAIDQASILSTRISVYD